MSSQRISDAQHLSVIDLFGAVERRKASGDIPSGLKLYKDWIAAHRGHALLHAVYFNYGVLLAEAGELETAKTALSEAIRINPKFLPPYINLGTLLERMGDIIAAIAQWTHVADFLGEVTGLQLTYKTSALKNLGRVFEAAHLDGKAEEALRLSLDVNPLQRDVLQQWVSLRQRQWKWPVITPWEGMTAAAMKQGMSPLSAACYADDPIFHLANAHYYAKEDVGRPDRFHDAAEFADRKADPSRPLRIGYVSSDLREHAVGFLTAELFGLHDRQKVEVFVYYCGIAAEDSTKERIRASVDHWHNITPLDDDQAADLIVGDKIDILVDLNAYTKDARVKVFARRPAPIIVNWLGFPGTTGSPTHHYIVADDFIIRPEDEVFYTEKVLRLPCYQPNDRKRAVATASSRQEAGLPEGATVFCGFNGTQKITPFVFEGWIEILKRCPGSVLWLLTGGDEANERLTAFALQRGLAPERIVFADKQPNARHVARYALADLFLDTFPYGAHTTASDALWMGVPVLTRPGRSFASRVCGSLVRAAGLADFICETTQDYIERAVELGNDRPRLQARREMLLAGRQTSLLFDLPRLVSSLEQLYGQMWDDFRHDRLPRPDLANMELYREIGCGNDHEGHEFRAGPDYVERCRARLAELHRFSPIAADRRIWTSPS